MGPLWGWPLMGPMGWLMGPMGWLMGIPLGGIALMGEPGAPPGYAGYPPGLEARLTMLTPPLQVGASGNKA